jgi:hypothetical protein
VGGLGACDPLQHQRDLAGENLQNFSFKALIAQRHPSQVVLIEDVVSRPPVLCHDILSRPRFGFFVPGGIFLS